MDPTNKKRRCCVIPPTTLVSIRPSDGHLCTHGITSICGRITLALGNSRPGNSQTATLNSNLCMQNQTLSTARLHATEGVTAGCISASSLVTAGCVSASGSITAESIVSTKVVSTSVHVGKALTVESGVIQRCNGATLTLAACLGGVSLIDSNLCLRNKSLTAASASVTTGVIHRPLGAKLSLGTRGAHSVLTSHLQVKGNLTATAVFAPVFNRSVAKLGSANVSEIEQALSVLTAFDYLQYSTTSTTMEFEPLNIGMDAEQVRKVMPSHVASFGSSHTNYVDYANMVPLMGAAIKDLYAQRTRIGRVTLVGGTTRANVAQKHRQVIATLVTKAPLVVVFAQNETGWAQVRAHMVSDDGQPVVVIECAEATSVDRVVYIIMLG